MKECFPIYVKQTGLGCLLSCEGFETIEAAREYIKNELIDALFTGDVITIEGNDNE